MLCEDWEGGREAIRYAQAAMMESLLEAVCLGARAGDQLVVMGIGEFRLIGRMRNCAAGCFVTYQ